MTVKELIEKLEELPGNFEVEVLYPYSNGESEWASLTEIEMYSSRSTVRLS